MAGSGARGLPFSEENLFQAGSRRYVYRWRTRAAWAGQCRRLRLAFADGTTVVARFRFKAFGFRTPTLPPPAINVAAAPSDVPVRFVVGLLGHPLFGSVPLSQQVDCATGTPIGRAIGTRGSGPMRDPQPGVYSYLWGVPPEFAGSCRQLLLRLGPFGASMQIASYRFVARQAGGPADPPPGPSSPVPPVNRAPIAVDDAGSGFETGEDAQLTTGSLLTNDTDPDGDALAVQSLSTNTTVGTVADQGNGTVDYDPDGEFEALDGGETDTDSFGYTVTDGRGQTASATATITVAGVNDAPVVAGDTASVDENAANGSAVHTATFTDVEPAQDHVFSIVGGNASGAFAIDPATGEITVADTSELDHEATSSYSLTVRVTDDGTPAEHGEATVEIDVLDVNEEPDAVDDSGSGFGTDEDAPFTTASLTANDTDPDGDTLTVQSLSTAGTQGAAALQGNGTVDYDPDGEFEELDGGETDTDSFDYVVSDGAGGTGGATVTITVSGVNDAPVATDGSASIPESAANGTAVHTVAFTDAEPSQDHAFSIVGGNSSGAFAIDSTTGAITVADATELDHEAAASYSLTVRVTDDGTPDKHGDATIDVTVQDVNEAPDAVDDGGSGFGTDEDAPFTTASLTANDTDPDGDTLTVQSLSTGATEGAAVLQGDGTVDYDPDGEFEELDGGETDTDSFGYTVADPGGETDTATATVTVNGVNDAPVATGGSTSIPENSANGTEVLTVGFTDVEPGQDHVFSIVGGNSSGAFAIDPASGAITVADSAELDYETTTSFSLTVRVTDDGTPAKHDDATVTVTVQDLADSPTAANASALVDEEALSTSTGALVTGSNPPSTAEIATGNLTYDFGSNGSAAVLPFTWGTSVIASDPEGGDPSLGALASHGQPVTWSVSPDGLTLTGSASSQAVITVQMLNVSTGSYRVTLLGQLDHPDAGQRDANDQIRISVPYTVKDAAGNTASSTLAVSVNDDGPSGQSQTHSLGVGTDKTNLMLILDVSGSQEEPSGLTGLTRMDVMKAVVGELVDRYDERGDLAVRVVTFSTNASTHGSSWESAASATAFVNALAAGGNTNYDEAVADAMTGFGSSGKLAGGSNVSYFISDGEPNQPSGSAGISAAEEAAWQNFLNTNDIRSLAIGIGPSASAAALNPIAYDGRNGTQANALVYTDLASIAPPAGLPLDTIDPSESGTASGSMTANAPIGADQAGSLRAIQVVGGRTYTYNAGTDSITPSGTGTDTHSFNATTNVLTVTMGTGATLTVDFDDASYLYVPDLGSDSSDAFGFVFGDFDDDTATATLTVDHTDADTAPIARPDRVLTNVTGSGATISMLDHWLLFNDSDSQGDAISLTGVSSASSGSVSDGAGTVNFTDNSSDGGSFIYTAAAGSLSDTTTVTIDRLQAGESTLDGTGFGDVLVGRDSSTTFNGYEGADVIAGGIANDTVSGDAGADRLDGGVGNDTVTGDAGDDTIDVSDDNDTARYASVLDGTDLVESFDGNASGGQDVLDLDALFDSLGVAAASRAARVQIVDNGGTVEVNVNANAAGPDFELHVADIETTDAITVGSDVLVGS